MENFLNLPDTISLQALQDSRDACFDPEKLNRYEAIVSGGDKFRALIDEFLIKKAGESSENFEYRKKRAFYMPIGSGFLSWIVSTMFRKPIQLSSPDDESGYWEGLNQNCDGNFGDLQQLFKDVSNETFMFGGGAFGLTFDPDDAENARWHSLCASELDAREQADDGKLIWIRKTKTGISRVNPYTYGPKTTTWTYYTTKDIVVYQYIETPEDAKLSNDKKMATMVSATPHDFEVVPIFPVRCVPGQWILDIIYDTLIALFNRQVSITTAVDIIVMCTQVYKTLQNGGTDITEASKMTMNAIRLFVGEDFDFKAPPSDITAPAFTDEARIKQNLIDVVQAQAIQAVNQKQNPRQAAAAKQIDREPFDVFIDARRAPVIDAFEAAMQALKEYRGEEDLEVTIQGVQPSNPTPEERQKQADQLRTVLGVQTPTEADDDDSDKVPLNPSVVNRELVPATY